ncbi:DUF732 domain-containing protein [Nocardioides sambongensis]|uniref:DUF732 domain-containing protein n=1 Tax=Nocardioides sambongensis TaxID=2589074 RepID=UPI0018C89EA0|nr:DUF732 domain-containing protein [Nocardioides sambongensis]
MMEDGGFTTDSVERRRDKWVYAFFGAVLAVLCVVALILFDRGRDTVQAADKADEFIAALQAEGLTAPSQDQVARVLGEDGGALCDDPGHGLRRSLMNMQLGNGAAGPGMRPTLVDSARLLKGQIIAIEVYCPEELEKFRDYVDELDSEDVTEG